MTTRLSLLAIIALLPLACAALETNGFLVFEIDRYPYVEGHRGDSNEVKQAFKVPLTGEFISNFDHAPNQNSVGSGFYCQGGSLKNGRGGTSFMWWVHRTKDGRWSINMWGMGAETIQGTRLTSMDPNVTQCVTVKKLEDLDSSYRISYVNKHDGVNVSFGAKYMTVAEVLAADAIPTAPVKKADDSWLFTGDVPMNCPIAFRCGFQEN